MKDGDSRSALVEAYVRGETTSESIAALEDALRSDAEFRREFLDYLNLDLALSLELGAPEFSEKNDAAPEVVPFPTEKPRRNYPSIAAAAVITLLLVSATLWNSFTKPSAEITQAIGAQAIQLGDAIGGERVELDEGLLEMRSPKGARIVVEAPAAFQFESDQTLRLFRGRLSAEVPESAHGFTVLTPSGKAIDLGTEFGVDVPVDGEPEIHVFDGEVVAHAEDGEPLHLFEGDAFTLASGGGLTRDLRSAAFVRAEEMSWFPEADPIERKAQSEATLAKWKSDPDLIALLDFENAETAREGQFRTCQGRWPGSRALEFVTEGDHLKLDVGGDRDWPELTLSAWVRLDRLGAPYQSLLHTDGWDGDNPGQVHWMLTHLETMRLALRNNALAPSEQGGKGFPDSTTSVLPEKGRWVHLVTVYDAPGKQVRFYLNGQLDQETRLAIAHPARLGKAQIGNWDRNDRKLSGRVDEMLLLGRCLDDDEVRALFDSGNPYRSTAH